MHGEEKRFAHVVLFECPWCLRLLSSAFLSFDERLKDPSNEQVDSQSTAMGGGGWVGKALDVASASHSVQPWSRALTASSPLGVRTIEGFTEQRDWLFLVAKQIGSISGQKFGDTPP